MTSIPMAVEPSPLVRTVQRFADWGSGKHVQGPRLQPEQIWNPCNEPTWHYSGHPLNQEYSLTQLKLSNVRLNDQLLPKPQECRMSYDAINLPYPADHPYLSHIPQKDVLPNFDSPDDPQRGNEAKRNPPLHPTAGRKNDTTIIEQKVKGFGYRLEKETILPESQKMGHLQSADKSFFQNLKTPSSGQQIFYPIPLKLFGTNSDNRPNHLRISARTANALRNVERNQWLPDYTLNYTGYGPTNPMKLDNFEDKLEASRHRAGAQVDETLYPNSVPTFVPPRPVEGVVARHLAGRTTNQRPKYRNDQEMKKPESETERQERWLKNDREYVNLPEPPFRDGRWKEMEYAASSGAALESVAAALALKRSQSQPNLSSGSESQHPKAKNYLPEMKAAMKRDVQEMEARNRLKALEVSTPEGNVSALRRKLKLASKFETANVFYDHVGKFVGERGGLYQTSYQPHQLAASLGREGVKAEVQLNSPESLHVETGLNGEMDGVNRDSATYLKVASSAPPPHLPVAIEDFKKMKAIKNLRLMPNSINAAAVMQEGGFVETTTSLTSAYNFPKFLQEQELGAHVQADASRAISNENHRISNVKVRVATPALVPSTASSSADRAPTPRRPIPDTEMPEEVVVERVAPVDENVGSTNPRIINLSAPDKDAERRTKDWRHSWRPGEGVPRPQSLLTNLQNAFRKSQVHRKFHATFPETAPDLRDHGVLKHVRKHEFTGGNAQMLRGHVADVPSFPC